MHTVAAERFPSARVGSFTMHFANRRFQWSPEVAAIHGYPAEPMTVPAEFVMAHKHPDDREQVQALLDELLDTGTPLSSRHRIVDRAGDIHHVVVISTAMPDNTGEVTGVQGFYVDISSVFDEADGEATPLKKPRKKKVQAVESEVADFAAHRAVIERATGMVMMAYNLPAERAFDVIRWRAQQSNTKVRALCEMLIKRCVEDIILPSASRATFDRILLPGE